MAKILMAELFVADQHQQEVMRNIINCSVYKVGYIMGWIRNQIPLYRHPLAGRL